MAMQSFAYKVRDPQGKLVTGTLEAESVTVVAGKLRQMGYVPVSIESSEPSASAREIKIPFFSGRIKLKDVAVFSRQFATMINSGLTLLRSLSILADQTENKELARIIGEVRKDVETRPRRSRRRWPSTRRPSPASTWPWSARARRAARSTPSSAGWPRPSRSRSSCAARSSRP